MLERPLGTGCAEVSEAHCDEAVGQAVTDASEVQDENSEPRDDQSDVAVG